MELTTVGTSYRDNAYTFVNETVNTRNGFAHISRLFIDGIQVSENKVNYLNRTWEQYRYQTAMMGAVHKLIKERKDDLERAFKHANGIKKMTESRRKELEDIWNKDEFLDEYYELYNAIRFWEYY